MVVVANIVVEVVVDYIVVEVVVEYIVVEEVVAYVVGVKEGNRDQNQALETAFIGKWKKCIQKNNSQITVFVFKKNSFTLMEMMRNSLTETGGWRAAK